MSELVKPVTKRLTPKEKYPELWALFTKLQERKAEIEKTVTPLRQKRDELARLLAPIEAEMKKVADLIEPFKPELASIDSQLSVLSKSMGGKSLGKLEEE